MAMIFMTTTWTTAIISSRMLFFFHFYKISGTYLGSYWTCAVCLELPNTFFYIRKKNVFFGAAMPPLKKNSHRRVDKTINLCDVFESKVWKTRSIFLLKIFKDYFLKWIDLFAFLEWQKSMFTKENYHFLIFFHTNFYKKMSNNVPCKL